MTLADRAFVAGKVLAEPLFDDPDGDEVIRRLDKEDEEDQLEDLLWMYGDCEPPDDVELTDEELDQLRRENEEFEDR